MTDAISTRPPTVVLLAAVALSLVTLDVYGPTGPAVAVLRGAIRSGLLPVESAADATFRPFGNVAAGIGRGQKLARENARLRRTVSRSRSERARLESLAQENRDLSGALRLATPAGASKVAARVVSLPAGRAAGTLVLDRGREDGVAPGMPVVASGGLVGRVVETTRHRASVLPLSDPGSVVGVRVGAANAVGMVQGRRLDLLDPRVEVHRGDLAVTSGLRHSRFPPDLPVGRVAGAGRGKAQVEMLAEADRLDVVQVLIWRASE